MSDRQGSAGLSGQPALLRLGGALLLGKAWFSHGLAGEGTSRPPEGEDRAEFVRELSSYIAGFVLAVLLTGAAFGLVYWSALPHAWLMIAVGAFALIQIAVHFRFFLHIDLSQQKREDLQLILFSALILAIMVGGTIWILGDLASRM